MNEVILIGRQERIIEFDAAVWRRQVMHSHHQPSTRLSFMTQDHHRVRNFAVTELPRNNGKTLSAEVISEQLSLPLTQVMAILDDLQQHLVFLVQQPAGDVRWAFPVTIEPTPHRLRFSSGEQIYAAWAEDALATPFVQGRLRHEDLSIEIATACAHCDQPLHITLDSELHWSVQEQDATPYIFMPDIDWNHFTEPTIIDVYWRNSLFFWSEEHVRGFRGKQRHVDGLYLTMEQAMLATKVGQGRLFGFEGGNMVMK